MSTAHMVVFEEEFRSLEDALRRLRHDANAKAVFLIDKNGQQIAAAGEIENFDSTSLASLTAGNVAATDGLAKLIGEREFSVLFHEGQRGDGQDLRRHEPQEREGTRGAGAGKPLFGDYRRRHRLAVQRLTA